MLYPLSYSRLRTAYVVTTGTHDDRHELLDEDGTTGLMRRFFISRLSNISARAKLESC